MITVDCKEGHLVEGVQKEKYGRLYGIVAQILYPIFFALVPKPLTVVLAIANTALLFKYWTCKLSFFNRVGLVMEAAITVRVVITPLCNRPSKWGFIGSITEGCVISYSLCNSIFYRKCRAETPSPVPNLSPNLSYVLPEDRGNTN